MGRAPMLSCGFLWTGPSWCPLAFRPTYLRGHPQVACCRTWPRTAAWWVAAAPQRTRGMAGRCGWSSALHAVAARGRTAQSTARYRGITAKPPPNCLCPPLPLLCPTQGAPTYLTPLTRHPAGGGTAAQVAAHGGWRLGRGWAVRGRQRGAVVGALAKNYAVAEAWPAAGGALQLEEVFYA